MGTSERFIHTAPCPCAQGSLQRDFISPDYRYSLSYCTEVIFNCSTCSADWQISRDGKKLTHQSINTCKAKVALTAAYDLRSSLNSELQSLKETTLREVLQAAGAKTKASEHRYVQNRRLFDGSYESYRRDGRSVAAARLDPAQIPACLHVLTQLHSADTAIDSLREVYRRWLDARRDHVEFTLQWR